MKLFWFRNNGKATITIAARSFGDAAILVRSITIGQYHMWDYSGNNTSDTTLDDADAYVFDLQID